MLDHQSTEEWRTVAEFPSYEVSDLGRIRRKAIERPHNSAGGIQRYPERLRKLMLNPVTGYVEILFCENRVKTMQRVHRIVAAAFLEEDLARPTVNHKNGDKADNRLANLEYMDCSENHLHAFRELGRKPKNNQGRNNPASKLTEDAVRDIRAHVHNRENRSTLACKYGVHGGTINAVWCQTKWVHLQ